MQKVWITGASSGIGLACALRYASQGAQLVLTALPAGNQLEEAAQKCRAAGAAGVEALPYDFSDPSGLQALCDAAWAAFGGLDIVYCNAGISQRTLIEDTSEEMVRKIMEIDFFAPEFIARTVLPHMLAQGGGHIAVTSSISGKFGFPLRSAYASAKFALYGFFETLQAEYWHRGIRVTIVCPGRVQTAISMSALDKGGKPHGQMDPGQAGGITPERAARIIVRAIARGKREVLVGGKELLMVPIKRFFPGLCARLVRRIKPQ
jgi:NAD(P)-dependent dehydrogenase (short-subunit alcohol dehydrogenase family)